MAITLNPLGVRTFQLFIPPAMPGAINIYALRAIVFSAICLTTNSCAGAETLKFVL